MDYLRGALVSLVVLHHVAITYGGAGAFYYTEPATDPVAAGLLTLFTNFNQGWFMGAFFLISGYFTPASLDRKGVRLFLRDRLIRLGLPLVFFFFVLSPLTIYIAFSRMSPAELAAQGITPPMGLNWTFISQAAGIGPLWFVELLLFFEIGYVVWRVATRRREANESGRPFPSSRKIGAFILILALSAYLLRAVIPINVFVLGFPSLFDLPQYLGLFLVGTAAAGGDWLMKMPDSAARRFLIIALVATATLLPLSIIGTDAPSLGWGSLFGFGTLSSAIYALWDSTFAVGMTMFAISFFRKRFNSPGRLWSFAAKNFYAAYVLQVTVIVTVSVLLLYQIRLESMLKFAVASVIVLPSTWALAYAVRKIPLVDRIL